MRHLCIFIFLIEVILYYKNNCENIKKKCQIYHYIQINISKVNLKKYYLVIGKYRQKLLEKGANTIATLSRVFKNVPSYDNNNIVNSTDFFNPLSSCGLHIIKEEASLIWRFFDQDNSGMLNFEEFLFALRGKPNEERQNEIDYDFNIFNNGSDVMLIKWNKFLIVKNILNLLWEN